MYFDTSVICPQWFCRVKFVTPTFCIATILRLNMAIQPAVGFYNLWANIHCSGCSPLGENHSEAGPLLTCRCRSEGMSRVHDMFDLVVPRPKPMQPGVCRESMPTLTVRTLLEILWIFMGMGAPDHSQVGESALKGIQDPVCKNFSQWESGFLWKLRSHRLKRLRQRQVATFRWYRNMIGRLCQNSTHWARHNSNMSRYNFNQSQRR